MILSIPKFFLNLIIGIFFFYFGISQTLPYPKIETPNTASLGKYGDIPVSYFTGTPNISFSLYNLVEGHIQIPISLSYHPGSVKPNEHPGWVGLGWNLNCYGKITRTVRMWTDEGNNGSPSIKPYYPDPTYHGSQHGATFINTTDWDSPSRIQTVYTYNSQSPASFYDTDADEFSFNFGNYSGKFYYTANGWQVVSDEPNIKIQELGYMDWQEINRHLVDYQLPGIGGGFEVQSRMFRGFIITTPDGTRYTFGCLNSIGYDTMDGVEFSKNYPVSGGVLCNSWLLRKIEDKDGKSIVFEYQKKKPVCTLSFHTTQTSYTCYYDWASYSSWAAGPVNTNQHDGFLQYPVYLKKITTSKETINFNISVSTELRYTDQYFRYASYDPVLLEYNLSALYSDVNNLQWYKLDDIIVQDFATSNPIKKVKFNYSSSATQRLTLNSFSEHDKISVNIKNYQFTYNDIAGLPAYGGDKTDHWGYYNGTALQGASFANLINLRNSNSTLITKGTLHSVIYPTGGTTEFVWESNFVGSVVSISRQALDVYNYGYVGGVRIKEIKNYSVIGGTPLTTSYYYVKNYTNFANLSTLASSGVLNGLPQYYFNIPTRVASDGSSRVGYLLESVNSLVSYSYNGSASHVGYSEVIEKLPDNSYNKYLYTNFSKYDNEDEDHYDKTPGVIGWIPGASEDRYVTMSSLEGERGKLIVKETYRNDNKLLEKTRNFYRKDAARFSDFIKIYDLRNSLACESYAAVILASAYKAFKYNYFIVKTEKTVFDINGANPLVTTTEIQYNAFNQVSSTRTSQSDNSTIINKFKYPSDFTIFSIPNWEVAALQSMRNRNILVPKIEHQLLKETGVEQKLLKGNLTLYKQFSGSLILPYEELQTELGTPSSDLTSLSINASNQLVYHGAYRSLITANLYDSKGNLLEQQKINNIKQSFIWDYSDIYLIAQVINSAAADIAYTSFEADGKGNWTFTGTPTTDATAPTGKKVYTVSNNITKSGLSTTATYIVSYWKKSGTVAVNGTTPTTGKTINGWTYYEHKVVNPASGLITVSGTSGVIDELRLYPATAQMTTYTYEPLIGMTNHCDANNKITYYEYDDFSRLMLVRDQDKNILKKICYNYAGQPESCTQYTNAPQSQIIRKNNCTDCQVGSYVTYTVPAGTYISNNSQVDADQQALNDINANGQAYANTHGICTAPPNAGANARSFISSNVYIIFTNNCTGVNYSYTLNANSTPSFGPFPAGTYTIYMSSSGTYTYMINGYSQTSSSPVNFFNIVINGAASIQVTN